MEIPKFSDLSERKSLDGDKIKIDDVLNNPIVVTGYNVSSSKYKDKNNDKCVKVQFYFVSDEKAERRVFFSGSGVIKDQVEDMEKQLTEKGLPFKFETTVKKVGNYYSFI